MSCMIQFGTPDNPPVLLSNLFGSDSRSQMKRSRVSVSHVYSDDIIKLFKKVGIFYNPSFVFPL